MKICCHCRNDIPLSEYGKNSTKPDGLEAACRPCIRSMQNARRQQLRERDAASIVLPETQRCDRCREVKAASDFYRQNDRKCGLNRLCKPCCQTKTQYYRAKYSDDDPVRFKLQIMVSQAKTRSKEEHVPFDLTLTYLMENFAETTHCPILGIPLDWAVAGHPGNSSPSLDKKIPARGYVPGNVWIISHLANVMKQDASPEVLHKFARWALTFEG